MEFLPGYPGRDQGGEKLALLAFTAVAEAASWAHYLLLVTGGGETLPAVLATQGLALGFRSATNWWLLLR